LAGFEDLIRGALLKQGAPNAANRQKVYESAHQALERMLESNDAMTPEIACSTNASANAADTCTKYRTRRNAVAGCDHRTADTPR